MSLKNHEVVSLDDELLRHFKHEPTTTSFPKKQDNHVQKQKTKFSKALLPDLIPKIEENLHADWSSYGIDEDILSRLDALELHSPTLIQKLVLKNTPSSRHGILPNIIGTAPTGSGKTLAFLIPLLQALKSILTTKKVCIESIDENKEDAADKEPNNRYPISALIVVPTRELAFQIHTVALSLVKDTDTRLALLTGGISIQKQQRILSKKVDLLISTPGRLWCHINDEKDELNLKERVSRISYLVVDECDRMLEGSGHFSELWPILEMLQPASFMIFSATFDKIKCSKLFEKFPLSTPPIYLSAITSDTSCKPLSALPSTISTFRIRCRPSDKDAILVYLLEASPFTPTIVFVNSVAMIRRLCPILQLLGIKALPLHSQMPQRQRLKNIDRIKDTSSGYILIATDVVGRGIDLPHVSRIIHFQLPLTLEQFVHRSGRTGRANATGAAYLLISPEDQHQFSLLFSKGFQVKEDPAIEDMLWNSDYLSKIKERLEIAIFIDSHEHETRKQGSTKSLTKLLDEDKRDENFEKKHSKKNKKANGDPFEDEEERVFRQMIAAKVTKMKRRLRTLNEK